MPIIPAIYINHSSRIQFTAVILIASALRLFQLGHDGLWVDEINVAQAAVQPTVKEAVNVFRNHVMPMPFDYIIAWLVARVSIEESALRLPAAIWGILVVAVSYLLYKRLSNREMALIGALLLAVSPVHLHYSQELRFYSALIFFFLLSNLLLLRAIEKPTKMRWLTFLFATLIGVYFHVFVALIILNGILFMIVYYWQGKNSKQNLLYFLASICIIAISILPPYLEFQAGKSYQLDLFAYSSLELEIGYGLGWIAWPYNLSNQWASIYGIICLIFGVIGFIYSLRERKSLLWALAISIPIQIGTVITLAAINNFTFVHRQIVFLLPSVYLFTAIGCVICSKWIGRQLIIKDHAQIRDTAVRQVSSEKLWMTIVAVFILLSSIPALVNYYSWPKSNVDKIIPAVIHNWKPGDTILVSPIYQGKVIRYYLQYLYDRPDMLTSLIEIDQSMISTPIENHRNLLVYMHVLPENAHTDIRFLQDHGYRPLFTEQANFLWSNSLFVNP